MSCKRDSTKKITVRGVDIGGGAPVTVQSMCNTKTEDVEATVRQILALEEAGFVDGIAGGGGIISVPTYFLVGLPAHLALGTNKLSSCIGTAVSTGRFIRGGYVDWKLGIPGVILALCGSALGTRLQLRLDENYLKWLLLIILPITAAVVLRQRSFPEARGTIAPGKQADYEIYLG